THLTETYDALNGGRLKTSTDADGKMLTYTYDPNNGNLTTVTSDSGETVSFNWSGGNLQSLVTTLHDENGNVVGTLKRTRYNYDTQHRLHEVITDLSPDDSDISDENTVVTTYEYDGTSDRVKSISQTGGAKIEFDYELVEVGQDLFRYQV